MAGPINGTTTGMTLRAGERVRDMAEETVLAGVVLAIMAESAGEEVAEE